MIKILMRYIIEYLLSKKIIKLLKIENSFFLYKHLDKRLKLTKEVIYLNYYKESPYSINNSTIITIMNKNNLYLWFTKKSNNYYLPETLILYRKIINKYSNIVVIFEDKVDKIIIIKDDILLSSFSKVNISEKDLLLIKHEYEISETIRFNKEEYLTYLDSSLEFLKISDIFNILNIELDIKKFLLGTVRYVAIPFFVASILISLMLGIYLYSLEKEKNNIYDNYKSRQLSVMKIKTNIEEYKNKNELFKQLSKEFIYVDKTLVLSQIIKTASDVNATMFYLKINDNNVNFIIKVKKRKIIPLYIKELFKSGLFNDIKNLSSRKQKDNFIEVTIRAKLKERE